jgi:hypothetical protein
MTDRRTCRAFLVLVLALGCLAPTAVRADALSSETIRALETSPYVYIATQRKDGSFGSPAEIWFMWDQGAVWMASPTTTWRVKRIQAGRTAARIAVGSRSGPSFAARGAIVRDPAAYDRLYATFAKKYPDRWPGYETRFRDGLKDGTRVLMRYDPVGPGGAAKPAPTPTPGP